MRDWCRSDLFPGSGVELAADVRNIAPRPVARWGRRGLGVKVTKKIGEITTDLLMIQAFILRLARNLRNACRTV